MGTIAYKPLTQVENAFKTIVWTPMVRAGETWLEGSCPFFALPVIQSLEESAVDDLSDALFEFLRLQIDLAAIKLVSTERQSLWENSVEKLDIIAKEQGENSDAYKKALNDEALRFAQFVHTGP